MLAQQAVSRAPFTESGHAIRAFSPSGDVTIPVISVQIEIQHSSGRHERGDLTAIYDPASGHYFWRFLRAQHPGDTTSFTSALESGMVAVYASAAGLFDFAMSNAIFAEAHNGRANSLDGAESAAIAEIERRLPEFERSGYDTSVSSAVPIFKEIGMDFACPPYGDPQFSQMCGFGAKSIPSVSRAGDNWRLVVRNRWDQEVILDSNFKLVSTKRLSEPVNGGRNQWEVTLPESGPRGHLL
jgi:hypothetical protein